MLRPRQYVSKSPQRARKLNRSYRARSISSGAFIRKMVLGVLLFIFDSVLIGWLSFKLWGFLCTDPEFSVRKIQIRGSKTFSTEEIIKRTGFVYGKNIFKIDIRAVRKTLEAEPLFKKVEVWRQLPSEILIKITEREPMAQIIPLEESGVYTDGSLLEGRTWLVDSDGIIVSEATKPANIYATVAIDLKKKELRRGNKILSEGLTRALKVLDIFSGSVLKKMIDLELIEVKDESDIVLKSTSGLSIHLGEDEYESRLIRLLSILEDLKKRDKDALSVDLRFRYVPVVLKEVEQSKNA